MLRLRSITHACIYLQRAIRVRFFELAGSLYYLIDRCGLPIADEEYIYRMND